MVVRIPDGCDTKKVRGPRGWETKIVRIRTPFDFVAFRGGRGVVFDAKTVDGETFPHSAIKEHQLISLISCADHTTRAGYLVWFRPIDTVVWFSHMRLQALAPRQSLAPSDGSIQIGRAMAMRLESLFE